jgi:hypothetical protein
VPATGTATESEDTGNAHHRLALSLRPPSGTRAHRLLRHTTGRAADFLRGLLGTVSAFADVLRGRVADNTPDLLARLGMSTTPLSESTRSTSAAAVHAGSSEARGLKLPWDAGPRPALLTARHNPPEPAGAGRGKGGPKAHREATRSALPATKAAGTLLGVGSGLSAYDPTHASVGTAFSRFASIHAWTSSRR